MLLLKRRRGLATQVTTLQFIFHHIYYYYYYYTNKLIKILYFIFYNKKVIDTITNSYTNCSFLSEKIYNKSRYLIDQRIRWEFKSENTSLHNWSHCKKLEECLSRTDVNEDNWLIVQDLREDHSKTDSL